MNNHSQPDDFECFYKGASPINLWPSNNRTLQLKHHFFGYARTWCNLECYEQCRVLLQYFVSTPAIRCIRASHFPRSTIILRPSRYFDFYFLAGSHEFHKPRLSIWSCASEAFLSVGACDKIRCSYQLIDNDRHRRPCRYTYIIVYL